ncbi:MAG TPA: nitrile hydratase subunit beta [Acidimicrobiales bacterium]|nr:nitrile hydratase subunit beta [Acidimicrobiales bacterium]
MDGVHDMGGMHGFGPVIRDPSDRALDEPPFHEPWEGRTFGLVVTTSAKGLRTGSTRPTIEEIEPATYLASSYYERWARAIEAVLVAGGSLTAAEIDQRSATVGGGPKRSQATDPELVAGIAAFINRPGTTSGEPVAAAFAVGNRVTVRRMAPLGHHRCPRYVRGATGTVERVNGGWPLADGDAPEAVYRVRFDMRQLWGDDAEPGALYIDLWERYLS